VLGHSLLYALVYGKQRFTGSPVHLAHELTAKSVDNTCNRGSRALANEVEIEHALNGSWLETVDEASCFVVEESMFGSRAQRTTGCSESADVVVG